MLRKDWKILVRIMGILLIGEGVLMLLCIIFSLYYQENTTIPFLISGLFTTAVGGFCYISTNHNKEPIERRMAYLIVTSIWIVMSAFGTIPYLATGAISNFTDAFFEMMSGFTTTGASIISDVESIPKTVLIWRSVSNWIGGVGIVMLVLAIVPSLGINSFSLYSAEFSGPIKNKTHSKIAATVRHLWITYLVLSLFFFVLLWIGDMNFFDAINHTFAAISSGGFSTKNTSISTMSPYSQYVLAIAMWVSGINLSLFYLFFKVKFRKLKSNLEQFLSYTFSFLILSIAVCITLHYAMSYGWEESFRYSFVQSASIISTTGYVVNDTTLWILPINFIFLIFCIRGGMAGSTSGGLKVMRMLIMEKNVRNVLGNRLHPRAYNPVRLNGKPISQDIIYNVMTLFFVYCFTIVAGVFLLILCRVDATESLGAVIGCITSYGPGLGACGGFGNYAYLPATAKWILSFCMLVGRLECITVYILFLRSFWKK